MTEKTIRNLINKLNANKAADFIFTRPLTKEVDFAKIWLTEFSPQSAIISNDHPNYFYFIKDSYGVYVGAVHDMGRDLHWYIIPKFRKQGHLSLNLKNVILPHLFQSKKEQRITIDISYIGQKNFRASEKVALGVGFIKRTDEQGKVDYILKRRNLKASPIITGQNTEMTMERMQELKKKVNYLSRTLWTVQVEAEMKFGTSQYTNDLKKLVDKLRSSALILEDAWYNMNENNS